MSLEGLRCLEGLVPSKPYEPTLTSNRLLILPYPTLKIGIGYWQHWILATLFIAALLQLNLYRLCKQWNLGLIKIPLFHLHAEEVDALETTRHAPFTLFTSLFTPS